jgi:hypothetical protein
MNTSNLTNRRRPKRLRRKKKSSSSSSAAALTFGYKSTTCLFIFAVLYGTFLICFQPMLRTNDATNLRDSLQKVRKPHHVKERLKNAKDRFVHKLRRKDGNVSGNGSGNVSGRNGHIDNDAAIATGAGSANKNEMDKQPKVKQQVKKQQVKKQQVKQDENNHRKVETEIQVDQSKKTRGFMVLGMHRSGTSMLSGLLVEGFGYKPGAPLIQPAYDNEKGFYELVPAVLQNDIFMYEQNVDWSSNVKNYDADRAYQRYKSGQIDFKRGTNALKILNDETYTPYLQKDPRMCITMRTWLPLLNNKPAIIFTYRHPLEVAMSLANRQNFQLSHGLRLWIHYNKAAVLNSSDLCRVVSSNNAVLANPLGETKRIASELTSKCNVPPSPKIIDQKIVDSFVDPTLQHNKNQLKSKENERKIIKTFNDGKCLVKEFDSSIKGGGGRHQSKQEKGYEMNMYLTAMKVYCDFESGEAYKDSYVWPTNI